MWPRCPKTTCADSRLQRPEVTLYLPQPYPDELLYGVIARYVGAGGRPVQAALVRTLGNHRFVKAEVGLPHWLSDLSESLAPSPATSPAQLAWRYTLWPYYGHYAPKEAVTLAYEAMNSSGEWLPAERRLRNQVAPPRRLAICRACAAEDASRFGEPYWHRMHQLPGVVVCARHGDTLLRTEIGNRGWERSQFHVVPHDHLSSGQPLPMVHGHDREYRWIAQQGARLLYRPLLASRTPRLFDWYRRRFSSYGLLTGDRFEARLAQVFKTHFSREFLMSLGLLPLTWARGDWIAALFRREVPLHPLCHSLVQALVRILENKNVD